MKDFRHLLAAKRFGIEILDFVAYKDIPAVNHTLIRAFSDCPLSGYELLVHGSPKPTDAMVIGSAVDLLICDPDRFDDEFYIRPDKYPTDKGDKDWSGQSTWCRMWITEHSDKPVLTTKDKEECLRLAEAVENDKRARDLLDQCRPQMSLFWVDKPTGLQMKGRPDGLGDRFAIDLKVTADAETFEFSKQIANLAYHQQAAIYADGIIANGGDCSDFYFIAVQRGERPKVNVRRLKCSAIEAGQHAYKARLRELKVCIESDVWPGYSGPGSEIGEIDLPPWSYSSAGMVELTIGGVAHAL